MKKVKSYLKKGVTKVKDLQANDAEKSLNNNADDENVNMEKMTIQE